MHCHTCNHRHCMYQRRLYWQWEVIHTIHQMQLYDTRHISSGIHLPANTTVCAYYGGIRHIFSTIVNRVFIPILHQFSTALQLQCYKKKMRWSRSTVNLQSFEGNSVDVHTFNTSLWHGIKFYGWRPEVYHNFTVKFVITSQIAIISFVCTLLSPLIQ